METAFLQPCLTRAHKSIQRPRPLIPKAKCVGGKKGSLFLFLEYWQGQEKEKKRLLEECQGLSQVPKANGDLNKVAGWHARLSNASVT